MLTSTTNYEIYDPDFDTNMEDGPHTPSPSSKQPYTPSIVSASYATSPTHPLFPSHRQTSDGTHTSPSHNTPGFHRATSPPQHETDDIKALPTLVGKELDASLRKLRLQEIYIAKHGPEYVQPPWYKDVRCRVATALDKTLEALSLMLREEAKTFLAENDYRKLKRQENYILRNPHSMPAPWYYDLRDAMATQMKCTPEQLRKQIIAELEIERKENNHKFRMRNINKREARQREREGREEREGFRVGKRERYRDREKQDREQQAVEYKKRVEEEQVWMEKRAWEKETQAVEYNKRMEEESRARMKAKQEESRRSLDEERMRHNAERRKNEDNSRSWRQFQHNHNRENSPERFTDNARCWTTWKNRETYGERRSYRERPGADRYIPSYHDDRRDYRRREY